MGMVLRLISYWQIPLEPAPFVLSNKKPALAGFLLCYVTVVSTFDLYVGICDA